jgi:transcription elongation factor GreA
MLLLLLENLLKNADVVDESDAPKGTVNIGSKVKVKDYDLDDTIEYFIVGSAEADPINGKISNESPVGKALMGKKKNDVVEASTPAGMIKMKIMAISRA